MAAQDTDNDNAPTSVRIAAVSWALKLIWQTSTAAVNWVVIFTLIRGITPAGFVVAIRGLINDATEQTTSTDGDFSILIPWLIFALVITLIEALSALASKYFSERLRGDLSLHTNNMVMQHAAMLDLPYFEDKENRETINRVRQNPGDRLYHFFISGQDTILTTFQACSLMAVLIWIEPSILLAAMLLALPFFVFQWRLARKRYDTAYRRSTKNRWTGYFLESLTSEKIVSEVKLLNIGKMLVGRFFSTMKEFRDQDIRLEAQQFFGSSMFTLFTIILFYLLFARVGYRVIESDLTIGDLAVFGGAIARLRISLDIAIRSAASCYEQILYIIDIKEFLVSVSTVPDKGKIELVNARGDLSVENISFHYPGTDKNVIRNLSFDLKAGETIAIVGENGSGKSTLAKLLIRLYDVDSGVIRLDDYPVTDYPLTSLHQQIALLSQNFGRFEASMTENIAYGNWEKLANDKDKIQAIAKVTGIDRLAETLPEGLDTPLGRRFAQHDLSGGQWQRLAIARTLARGASLLILDEPTSNIDARSENDLFQAIADMADDVSTIIISHRFSTIRMADRILVMHQGQIIEQGQHDALLQSNGHYAELYHLHERYRVASQT